MRWVTTAILASFALAGCGPSEEDTRLAEAQRLIPEVHNRTEEYLGLSCGETPSIAIASDYTVQDFLFGDRDLVIGSYNPTSNKITIQSVLFDLQDEDSEDLLEATLHHEMAHACNAATREALGDPRDSQTSERELDILDSILVGQSGEERLTEADAEYVKVVFLRETLEEGIAECLQRKLTGADPFWYDFDYWPRKIEEASTGAIRRGGYHIACPVLEQYRGDGLVALWDIPPVFAMDFDDPLGYRQMILDLLEEGKLLRSHASSALFHMNSKYDL